jgi:hypothetical protein
MGPAHLNTAYGLAHRPNPSRRSVRACAGAAHRPRTSALRPRGTVLQGVVSTCHPWRSPAHPCPLPWHEGQAKLLPFPCTSLLSTRSAWPCCHQWLPIHRASPPRCATDSHRPEPRPHAKPLWRTARSEPVAVFLSLPWAPQHHRQAPVQPPCLRAPHWRPAPPWPPSRRRQPLIVARRWPTTRCRGQLFSVSTSLSRPPKWVPCIVDLL